MRLYRAVKKKYVENFNGLGNSYRKGARWNFPSLPVLYFASSPSVAAIELANYFPSPDLVPPSYVMGVYELPNSIPYKTLYLKDMPEDWDEFPHPDSTKEIGSDWLRANQELCLFVPSAATPGNIENIIVVNPNHPQIQGLKLVAIIKDIYNPRMFSGYKTQNFR